MWSLLFVLSLSQAQAKDISSIIDQAQSLALKKDRHKASAILLAAVEANPPGDKSRGKILEALDKVSKVFFTDKGQKLYESGQSILFDTPDLALSQFREALALEDDNVQVLNDIARVQIAKQDCTGAEVTLQKATELNPYAVGSALLSLRALICQKKFDAFRERLKALPPVDKESEPFVQYMVAQDLLQQKLWRKSIDMLTKVSEELPQFPEAYYLLAKAGAEVGRNTEPWKEHYVSLCKNMSTRLRRKFSLEPRLCANSKEVEDELSKKTDI